MREVRHKLTELWEIQFYTKQRQEVVQIMGG